MHNQNLQLDKIWQVMNNHKYEKYKGYRGLTEWWVMVFTTERSGVQIYDRVKEQESRHELESIDCYDVWPKSYHEGPRHFMLTFTNAWEGYSGCRPNLNR